MNKLSSAGALLALAQENLAVPSSVAHRQRLRIRVPMGADSSDEGTTPEAYTDGDNDSAFDSEEDEERGLPIPRRLLPKSTNGLSESYRWPCVRKTSAFQQALPRKQLGKLPVRVASTRLALVPHPRCDVQRRLARHASMPVASVSDVSPGPSSIQVDLQAGIFKTARRLASGGRRIRLRGFPEAATASVPVPKARGDGGAGCAPNITALSPGDENTLHCKAKRERCPRDQDGELPSKPLPSKKRKLPPVPRSPVPRSKGESPHPSTVKKSPQSSRRDETPRENRQPEPVAPEEAGVSSPKHRTSASRDPDASMDLSCKEVIDMDEVMNAASEVRTPICRFLIPSWPQGVEGYEEVGGWRRLGGSTPDGIPRSGGRG